MLQQPIWLTSPGSLGTFPTNAPIIPIQLRANPVLPAVTVSYRLHSGSLPNGLTLTETGLITGTPEIVPLNTASTFVIRATDNLLNIRDRTFTITVTGAESPRFATPPGNILTQEDSTWTEFLIDVNNPAPNVPFSIRLVQGRLPPGLEINERGLIRGYPQPPLINVTLPPVNTSIVAISDNQLTAFSTAGFAVGRPILFSPTVIGSINPTITYFVREIFSDGTTFTVSTIPGGPTVELDDGVGFMPASLPSITQGQPTVSTFSFTLELTSDLGIDRASYSIVVANQNAPAAIGGANRPRNTRQPTIFNTRPPTFNIKDDDTNFSFYSLPDDKFGRTYPLDQPADIGRFVSDNQFAFKVMGHDFDSNVIRYDFQDLPLGLFGDPVTGWVTGNPVISNNTISDFSFQVSVFKEANPSIATPFITFRFIIRNGITGIIRWETPTVLQDINNGTVSLQRLDAISDVPLQYRLVSGTIPPNLQLLSNGELSGRVAFQPGIGFTEPGKNLTFSFTVEAFSPQFSVVSSRRTFEWTVNITTNQPTDNLYIKCTPSIADRNFVKTLLENEEIIPSEYLYRAEDPNFGKAKNIVYPHMFGVKAEEFDKYVEAIHEKNHYWRNITLGKLETAVARDEEGNIIYEVVYSKIIDNLVNPDNISVSKEVFWPRFIPLGIGPFFTSSTSIYTSYEQGFYTSLTPGKARLLYPNSLENMRLQISDTLGQVFDNDVLPRWMTSQQRNGSTTGFIQAWVICYTKPGFSEIVKENIETKWVDVIGRPLALNQINFKVDRFTVDKSSTYNFDTALEPGAWTGLPSANPIPDPIDSKNFYALFPRQTILPTESEQ